MAPSTVDYPWWQHRFWAGLVLSLLVKPGVFPAARFNYWPACDGNTVWRNRWRWLVALVVVFRAARDPKRSPLVLHAAPRMGSTSYWSFRSRQDGSYVTTEWFTFSYIRFFQSADTVLPSSKTTSLCFSPHFMIHEKLPVRFQGLVRVT